MKFNVTDKWLRTAEVARLLNKSPSTLLRLIDKGSVTPGVHFMKGEAVNSPVTWNFNALQNRLLKLMALPKPGSLLINNPKKQPTNE